MTSLQLQVPPTNSPEYSDHSSLSEPESSDSEWTDLGSTRDDDNDSDRESTSLPQSRRSSVSYTSSHGGDVDAWVGGLVTDTPAETTTDDAQAPFIIDEPLTNEINAAVPTMESDPQEDQLVNEALDQSMMSTLSSSRSSSLHASTVHNSLHDYRFPDPISSSREALSSTSYEDVSSPTDTAFSTGDADAPSYSAQLANPGLSPTPGVSTSPAPEEPHFTSFALPDLNISLYGFSSNIKWSFVDKLLEKVALGANVLLSSSLEDLDGPVRQIASRPQTERTGWFPAVISVVDRTQGTSGSMGDPFATYSTGRPSLAIVYVPSTPPHLPDHTWYLPVLVPPPCAVDSLESKDAIRSSAQQTWNMFNVPDNQILPLMTHSTSYVVDEQLLDQLQPIQAYRGFERLWTHNKKEKAVVNSTHALTILAVVSLVLGVVVGSRFPVTPPPTATFSTATPPPTTTAPSSIWALLRPVVNQSQGLPPPKAHITDAIVPSSLKDFALSVFNPPSIPSAPFARTSPTSETIAPSHSPISWAERFKYSTDLVLRPVPSGLSYDPRPKSLSIVPETSSSPQFSEGSLPTSPPPTSVYGLALNMRTSIPHVIETYVPAILTAVGNDIQDILDALDELVQAISRQAQFVITQTAALIQSSNTHLENIKGADSLKTIKETIYTRNQHAQQRAKEIRDLGKKWIFGAREMITQRTDRATEQAKKIAVEMAEEGWFGEGSGASVLRSDLDRKKDRARHRRRNAKSAQAKRPAADFVCNWGVCRH
ncbi:hypothetical protein BJ138DRAFT_1157607 [Hygrophoropsis aurantiaca]|uniref:Uncharacterized protein n=1 Tax=Hygrophoropsis aurantiaca TaxID=72124 RepID=A0ACB8A5Z1_9AGAM|nr:hypothetical protein BJ138DRAFT_1157607 [Hygrophoropsis aurantiaca]